MPDFSKNVFSIGDKNNSNTEVVSVTSGKGGVGKTNLSINLSLLLQQLNKKVLLFDADIHLGNIDVFLGLRPEKTIKDVVKGNDSIESTIIKGPNNLDILPASSAVVDLLEMGGSVINELKHAFTDLNDEYDIIVTDTGAGLSENVLPFILGGDKVVVVLTRDPASIADAYGIIKVTKKFYNNKPILLVPNMVRSKDEGEAIYKKMNLMVDRFLGSHVIYGGSILESDIVSEAIKNQKAVAVEHPNSESVKTMKTITRNLLKLPVSQDTNKEDFINRVVNHKDINLGEDDD